MGGGRRERASLSGDLGPCLWQQQLLLPWRMVLICSMPPRMSLRIFVLLVTSCSLLIRFAYCPAGAF